MLPELLEDDCMIDVSAFDTGDGRPVCVDRSARSSNHVRRDFELVLDQLEKAGLRGLPAGVVLCGDGAAGWDSASGGRGFSRASTHRNANGNLWADRSDLNPCIRDECGTVEVGARSGVRTIDQRWGSHWPILAAL
jgi:hypothetical protein